MTHRFNRRTLLGATAGAGLAAAAADARPSRRKHKAVTGFTAIKPLPGGGGVRIVQGKIAIDVVLTRAGSVSVIKRPADTRLSPDTLAGFFLPPSAYETAASYDAVRGVLHHGDIEVRINKAAGRLDILRKGRLILSDTGGFATQTFALAAASDLYGLGQFRDAMANYRDKTIYLAQANMDSCNPTLVSPQGWGLLWDTCTDAHLTSRGKTLTYEHTAPLVRYHVLPGDGIDGAIAAYRRLTGTAPLLGKYAYGYWQSQERYRSQGEITGIIDTSRAKGLPIDVMVQDWRYWGEDDQFSGMVWDKVNFSDPKGMCDHIHQNNGHIIASVWPAFGPASDVFKALQSEGLLFKGAHWGGGKVLDITSARAREIYWKHISAGLISVGLDGLWTDGCEPEFMSTGSRYVTAKSYAENGDCAAGAIKDNLLTFSYYQTRLIYGAMRKDFGDQKRPLTLSRKVYAGQQAFNAVTWSGDQFAAWQTLNYQIVAAQQFSLAGVPYWTDDIGGFLVSHRFPGGLDNPAYRELYVRWYQFGAFMPIFRAHGTEIRREVWAMGGDGDPAYEALKTALNLRYSLMPYIYAQAARVTFADETFLRPLVMDYGHDVNIARHPNQYMFGRDLMVAVVNTPLDKPVENTFEFIPNYAVVGLDGPAPEVAFYEGANFEKLVDTRHSDDLKMSWSGDIPFSLKGKPYSSRWKGRIVAQESGRHSLSIMTQGLIRFSLDGVVKVASRGKDEGTVNDANGGVSFKGHNGDDTYVFEMELKAGQAYVFELTQSQPTPDVVSLWVEWSRPSRRADLAVSPDKRFDVYLPAGNDWYDLHTHKAFKGGQTLSLRPDLGTMPVYVRAGAIVPMTPGIQYASQKTETTQLHVYAGADGAFTHYDDEGEGHGYETGARRHWPIRWDDSAGKLVFAAAQGTYPGAPTTTTFAITVHGKDGSAKTKTVTVSPSQSLNVEV